MVTSIDKALVSLVMSVAFMLTQFGINIPSWFTEGSISSAVAFLSPILVYLIPNKS